MRKPNEEREPPAVSLANCCQPRFSTGESECGLVAFAGTIPKRGGFSLLAVGRGEIALATSSPVMNWGAAKGGDGGDGCDGGDDEGVSQKIFCHRYRDHLHLCRCHNCPRYREEFEAKAKIAMERKEEDATSDTPAARLTLLAIGDLCCRQMKIFRLWTSFLLSSLMLRGKIVEDGR